MSRTVKVYHALVPARKPDDYILIEPDIIAGDGYRPTRIVKCPFGPLVMWGGKNGVTCAFCEGDCELLIDGKDGTRDWVDCPICDGDGKQIEFDGDPVWADPDGNVVEPEFIYHDAETYTISERWVAEWVSKQQAVQS